MINDVSLHPQNCRIDQVIALSKFHTTVDVLRLDLIHPVISGNKWFKLKEYLDEAKQANKKIIASFGGAYSNHIIATAAAAKASGLKSIGIIRGEKPTTFSHTLTDAVQFGMKLYFISRKDYKDKNVPQEVFEDCNKNSIYFIKEGGYGKKGAEGAKQILQLTDTSKYTHIIAAVGTGTTLAGLIESAQPYQEITGISVLKNNFSLVEEIKNLLPDAKKNRFTLIHDYHFGGYAKYTTELIRFMNNWYHQTGIPSDFVYTGKLFFAVNDLIEKKYFPPESKLLIIHSGGLQGNHSLPNGTLIF